ncbi:hypothetical protein LINGRAHAP2_LOCUS2819 [Linum grandiflorum]
MIIHNHHYHTPSQITTKSHQLRATTTSSNYSSTAINCRSTTSSRAEITRRRLAVSITVTQLVAACAALFVSPAAAAAKGKKGKGAAEEGQEEEGEETLGNVPQTLAGECGEEEGKDCNKKKMRIQRPKSRKAEVCTVKCVNTCIRGDEGEGPFNIRRPLVVFKQGFRSRHYW